MFDLRFTLVAGKPSPLGSARVALPCRDSGGDVRG
jgi:hypothetical protein